MDFFGLYRPKERNWGFCVNKIFMNKIKNKKIFFVDIKTQKKKGFMRVQDYHIKGKSNKTILITVITVIHTKQMMTFQDVRLE